MTLFPIYLIIWNQKIEIARAKNLIHLNITVLPNGSKIYNHHLYNQTPPHRTTGNPKLYQNFSKITRKPYPNLLSSLTGSVIFLGFFLHISTQKWGVVIIPGRLAKLTLLLWWILHLASKGAISFKIHIFCIIRRFKFR